MATASHKAEKLEDKVNEVVENTKEAAQEAVAGSAHKVEKGLDKAAEVAHNVTNKAVSSAGAAIDSTRKATNSGLDKAEKALQKLQTHADPAIDDLAHKALDVATKSINFAADASERTCQTVRELSEATNRYVVEKPGKALAIAAAAGALVALLLTSKRH